MFSLADDKPTRGASLISLQSFSGIAHSLLRFQMKTGIILSGLLAFLPHAAEAEQYTMGITGILTCNGKPAANDTEERLCNREAGKNSYLQ